MCRLIVKSFNYLGSRPRRDGAIGFLLSSTRPTGTLECACDGHVLTDFDGAGHLPSSHLIGDIKIAVKCDTKETRNQDERGKKKVFSMCDAYPV